MNTRTLALALTLALPLVAACSATSPRETDGSSGSGNGGAGAGHPTGSSSGAGGGDVIDGTGGNDALGDPIGTLTGKVVAPQGTIPISGALVYLTKFKPNAIASGVVCDKCVKLPAGTPYTLAKSDGMFELPYYSSGDYYLVTEKGHFRRVRPITLQEGTMGVEQSMTTLPPRTDEANGDTIPKMAIRMGQWDKIHETLIKLGIAKDAVDRFGTNTLSEAQDCMKSNPTYQFCPNKLFKDQAVLNRYQIVFVPCSDSQGTTCDTYSEADDNTVKSNLQGWVNAGGRLYSTDYSYEWARRPWPGYITWSGQTSETGSACNGSGANGVASVNDDDMQAWLDAQGIASINIQGSWTGIDHVSTLNGLDENGATVPIAPKVWVKSSANQPATVSFQQGCGRVLYSSYHMEGDAGAELLPQERALLYVLLEVGVCIGEIEPPK